MCPRQSRQQQLVSAQLCAHKIAQVQQRVKRASPQEMVGSIAIDIYGTNHLKTKPF